MQVRHVPARTGWRWVTEGFAILARAPLPLAATGMLMLFTLVISSIVPLLGTFLPLVLSPALSLGYLQTIRQVQEGRRATPPMLFSALRSLPRPVQAALLMIGVFNALATAGALIATVPVDDGQWVRLISGGQPLKTQDGAEADIAYAALLFMLLYAPIQVARW